VHYDQEAIASGFEEAEESGFFDQQRSDYRRRRDRLVEAFEQLGFPVAVPDAGYFFIVNMGKLKVELEPELWAESADPREREPNDYSICRWLTREIGVTAIPPSAFYEPANRHLASSWVRICFCKDDATIDMAIERLQKLRKYM
jgi:kynurenine aminotransferase